MGYIEMVIRNPGSAEEALIARLADMGATGFLIREGDLAAYFREEIEAAKAGEKLEQFRPVLELSGLDAGFTFTIHPLPELDWNETWKRNFQPVDVGDRLTVIPSWISPSTDRIPVIVDPAMVFGTGHHASTRACLAMVEKISLTSARDRFLDIGTGTGILAIAAAKLGFRHCIAVDTDPLAVENARQNIKLNGLSNVDVIEGEVTAATGTFDLITANLLSEILIQIAPEISFRLSPGGFAILSGMLAGQDLDVLRAMQGAGLSFCEKTLEDTWITAVVKKCISSEK